MGVTAQPEIAFLNCYPSLRPRLRLLCIHYQTQPQWKDLRISWTLQLSLADIFRYNPISGKAAGQFGSALVLLSADDGVLVKDCQDDVSF